MSKLSAKDLANDVPTMRAPSKPGPRVNAMAFKSFLFIFAFCRASCTTGIIDF